MKSTKDIIAEADNIMRVVELNSEMEQRNPMVQSVGIETHFQEKNQYNENLWRDKTIRGRFKCVFHYLFKFLIFCIPFIEFQIIILTTVIAFYSFEERGNGDMNQAMDYSVLVSTAVLIPILLIKSLRVYTSYDIEYETKSRFHIFWVGENSIADVYTLLVYKLILLILIIVVVELRQKCDSSSVQFQNTVCSMINQILKGNNNNEQN